MELTHLIAAVGSFLIGIGSVSVILKKYFMPARHVARLILDICEALDDEKLTKLEIEKILEDARSVKKALLTLKK